MASSTTKNRDTFLKATKIILSALKWIFIPHSANIFNFDPAIYFIFINVYWYVDGSYFVKKAKKKSLRLLRLHIMQFSFLLGWPFNFHTNFWFSRFQINILIFIICCTGYEHWTSDSINTEMCILVQRFSPALPAL